MARVSVKGEEIVWLSYLALPWLQDMKVRVELHVKGQAQEEDKMRDGE